VNACGKGGLACNTCSTGQSCTAGSCGSTFTGGGAGGGGGTGGGGGANCSPTTCATGCCKNNMCAPGTALDSCGTAGIVCVACTAGQECNRNACAMIAVVDSGVVDSGVVDSGTPAVDSGVVDSGMPEVDAGMVDSGMPVDAGMVITCGPAVVISQLFGAGGNVGGAFDADFVELHNRTNAPIDLTGWSLQYGSRFSVTNWSGNFSLHGSIAANGFLLAKVGDSDTTRDGGPLPAPFINSVDGGTFDMAIANGKVALVSSTTIINGACPSTPDVVDFVGYGTANCAKDAGVPALTSSLAGFRKEVGGTSPACVDTGSNAADFVSGTPVPRNAGSGTSTCVCTQ